MQRCKMALSEGPESHVLESRVEAVHCLVHKSLGIDSECRLQRDFGVEGSTLYGYHIIFLHDDYVASIFHSLLIIVN